MDAGVPARTDREGCVGLGSVSDADAGVASIQPPSGLEPVVRQIHVAVADGDADGR